MAQNKYVFKTILLGEQSVGKTSLFQRFTEDRFGEPVITTLSIEFGVKTVSVERDEVKLQVWDTAGQERFRSLTKSYYRNTHALLLVYDVTNAASFERLSSWMEDIKSTAESVAHVFLVGNKTDLNARAVSREQGQEFAAEHDCSFFETSALDGSNVHLVYQTAAERLLASAKAGEIRDMSEINRDTQPFKEPCPMCPCGPCGPPV